MAVAAQTTSATPSPPAGAPVSILDVMNEDSLLAEHFSGPSFAAWRVFLAALFALDPPTADAHALYTRCTGRQTWPAQRFRETVLVCGRRAGKTLTCALVLIYLALFGNYKLPTGTTPLIMAIAADRLQVLVLVRYMRALLESVPVLRKQVREFKKESIEFENGVVVRVTTASHRTTRGYTVVAAVCDEVAWWRTAETSAVPDREILSAIRPAMATVRDPLLLIISSPYREQGELWRLYKKHFGQDDAKVLVWQADTKTMNPEVADEVIAAAYEEDPASAAAEYGAQFRTDLDDFISDQVVRACVDAGIQTRPFVSGTHYRAFVDAAGGSGTDSMTLAIGHSEARNGAQVHVVDAIMERRPPFSPDAVVSEFVQLCRAYQVRSVTGDHYGGSFVREPFTRLGIGYRLTTMDRSKLYLATLPVLMSGRARLPDDERLIRQFVALERRTMPSGNDKVDHPRGGNDDVSNAAAGVIAELELHPRRDAAVAWVRHEAFL